MIKDFGSWPKTDKRWKDKIYKRWKGQIYQDIDIFWPKKMIRKEVKRLVKIHYPSTLGYTLRLILCLDFWLNSKVLGVQNDILRTQNDGDAKRIFYINNSYD